MSRRPKRSRCGRSAEVKALETPIGEGLGDLARPGPFSPVEVRDGPGHPQDSLDGPLGEREPAGRGVKERSRVGIEGAVAGDLHRTEFSVELAAAGDLDLAGAGHPGANRGARTLRATPRSSPPREAEVLPVAGRFVGWFPDQGKVQVKAVDERTGDPRLVAADRLGEAAAPIRAVSQVAAGAGVHGGDELETSGKFRLAGGPHDGDPARFERFAQHVEDGSAEFSQLVEEQEAVVGERDLARPGWYSAVR